MKCEESTTSGLLNGRNESDLLKFSKRLSDELHGHASNYRDFLGTWKATTCALVHEDSQSL
jgi:hypothetical protein